ncbi:hypothetical protein ACFL6I_07925 [candidate division KSB1 bacterium]
MKKRGKAQATVEYLVVVGMIFVIILPMVYILYSYSTDISAEVTESKMKRVADKLVNTAEEFYYLGPPSKTAVNIEMPPGVYEVYVTENSRELIFRLGDIYSSTDIVAVSNVDILSLLMPEDITPGRRKFRVAAIKDFAVIYTGNFSESLANWCAYYIPEQILRHARIVDAEGVSKAGRVIIPPECALTDINIGTNQILIDLLVEGEVDSFLTEFDDVSIEEEAPNVVGTASATYDFVFKNTFVQIGVPACRDDNLVPDGGDNDGFGIVMNSPICDFDCDNYVAWDEHPLCDTPFACDFTTGSCAKCVNPAAPDYCGDDIDNDCNGIIDDGFQNLGNPCHIGQGVCEADGVWECTPDNLDIYCNVGAAVISTPEICNDLDDDCDGLNDNNETGLPYPLQQTCPYTGPVGTEGIGLCRPPVQNCELGVFGACFDEVVPRIEMCDDSNCDGAGCDEDCDGAVNCDDIECSHIDAKFVKTTGGTPRIKTVWDGSNYGVIWAYDREVFFFKMDTQGNPIDISGDGNVGPLDYKEILTILDRAYYPSDLLWTGTEFAFAWENASTEKDIFLTRVDPVGDIISHTRISDAPRDSGKPSIAWNPIDEEYAIVWSDFNVDIPATTTYVESTIYLARADSDGKISGSEIMLTSVEDNKRAFYPHVSWNSESNEYGISWVDDRQLHGNDFKVFFTRVSGGVEQGVDSDLDGDIDDILIEKGVEDLYEPLLLWNPDYNEYGLFLYGGVLGDYHTYFTRIDPDGNILSSDINISHHYISSRKPSAVWNSDLGEYGVAMIGIEGINNYALFTRLTFDGNIISGIDELSDSQTTSPSIAWNSRDYGIVFPFSGAVYFASPGVPEKCDSLDNNCDDETDNNPSDVSDTLSRQCYNPAYAMNADVGICRRGIQGCSSGGWESCIGAVYPQPRNCVSEMDNDCDGKPDIGSEKQITDDDNDGYPQISGNILVWEEYDIPNSKYNILMCDMTLSGEPGSCELDQPKTLISSRDIGAPAPEPHIYGDVIVWVGKTGTTYNILMCKLSKNGGTGGCFETDTKTKITDDASTQTRPNIYGDMITWVMNNNIYMCELSKNGGNGGCLPANPKTQVNNVYTGPMDIYDGKVVYFTTSGTRGIYMCDINDNGGIGGCFLGDTKTLLTEANNVFSLTLYGEKLLWTGRKTTPGFGIRDELYLIHPIGTTEILIPTAIRGKESLTELSLFDDLLAIHIGILNTPGSSHIMELTTGDFLPLEGIDTSHDAVVESNKIAWENLNSNIFLMDCGMPPQRDLGIVAVKAEQDYVVKGNFLRFLISLMNNAPSSVSAYLTLVATNTDTSEVFTFDRHATLSSDLTSQAIITLTDTDISSLRVGVYDFTVQVYDDSGRTNLVVEKTEKELFAVTDSEPKLVFMTLAAYTGDLVGHAQSVGYSGTDGLDAADYLCQAEADGASAINTELAGRIFKVWLSDSTTDARDRLTHPTVPYTRADGVVVAFDWDDLVDGVPRREILTDIFGNLLFEQSSVWTATQNSGVKISTDSASNCDGWTIGDDLSMARIGNPLWYNTLIGQTQWTSYLNKPCNNARTRLYCFEQ